MKKNDIVESLISNHHHGIFVGHRFVVSKIFCDLAIVQDHRVPAIQFPFRVSDLKLAIEFVPESVTEHNDY